MKLGAFVLCLISTILMGIAIIPLIWCIPMTIKVYRAYKDNDFPSMRFNICVLLFVNIIAGILLLIDNEYPEL